MAMSKLGFFRVSMTLLVVFFAAVLAGCPFGTPASDPGKVAIVLTGNLAPDAAKDDEDISNDSLAAVYVTIESVTLQHEDGTSVSVLPSPVEIDVLTTEHVGGLLAAADIPPGVYVGGTVVISKAEVEFENDPGVRVPVTLPAGGEFSLDVDFELVSGAQGVLTLELDDIEIFEQEDSSLALEAELHLDTDIDDGEQGDNDDDNGEPDLLAGDIETAGVIDDVELENSSFEMEVGDSEIEVDYSAALISLPPLEEGGDAVAGTPADLQEDACVDVAGTLTITGNEIVLIAETIQVVALNCDEDDDDFDDNDGDNDDNDGDNGDDDGDNNDDDGDNDDDDGDNDDNDDGEIED